MMRFSECRIVEDGRGLTNSVDDVDFQVTSLRITDVKIDDLAVMVF